MTEVNQHDRNTAIEQLIEIMRLLRDENYGCPWDLEQSIASLVPHTLEEVYEVVDAIENNDMPQLRDELGDLLFQVVFYAQIARETALFDFEDVARGISEKLLRRHPHVFPDGQIDKFGRASELSAEQVVVNWEQIKSREKQEKLATAGGEQQPASVLDDVPHALPAMTRARKLQNRAARVGFDWNDLGPVMQKLKEEVAELEAAIAIQDQEQISAELGDVLFAAINVSRHTDVEAESALRACNGRFENRFRWIESELSARGQQLQDTGLEELDLLWDQAKAQGL